MRKLAIELAKALASFAAVYAICGAGTAALFFVLFPDSRAVDLFFVARIWPAWWFMAIVIFLVIMANKAAISA